MTIWNEYDKLKTVFIGKRFSEEICKHKWKDILKKSELDSMIRLNNETNEDLQKIEDFLITENVKVYRPNLEKYWDIVENYNSSIIDPGSCRDWCFAYGDLLIINQLSFPQRNFEYLFWEDAFIELEEQGKTVLQTFVSTINSEEYENSLKKFDQFASNRKYYEDVFLDLHEYSKKISTKDQISINPYRNTIESTEYIISNNAYPLYDKQLYLYNADETFKKKHLIHSASYFKHNDFIFGSPQGTFAGRRMFEKIIKGFYPKTKFYYESNIEHIDGSQTIVDKNLTMVADDDREIVKHIKPLVVENFKETMPITSNLVSDNLEDYFANLKGYDQRVDFDLNALTISPKRIIGGFFDIEKIKFLEANDIEVINIPLRHRWVLDGGIHCYTLDIDRYE